MLTWDELLAVAEQYLTPVVSLPDSLRNLAELTLPPYVLTHLALVIQRENIRAILDDLQDGPVIVERRSEGSDSSLYLLRQGSDALGERSRVILRVTEVEGGPLALLVGIATVQQWKIVVDRLLKYIYPSVYKPFLRQWELRSIFQSMHGSLVKGTSIRLTRVSSVKRLVHKDARRQFESGVIWTDVDYGDAFESAEEEVMYFRNVQFELCRRDERRASQISLGLTGLATRDAHFASNRRPLWLYESAVQASISRALEDRKLARERGRLHGIPQLARPIVAQFGEGVSLGRDDMPRILELLRNYQGVSLSVTHGNPYLDVTVVDMADGSAFDLVLASERRLMIVPQLRASESAVTRVCQFVYEHIGEAEFREATGTDA